MKKFNLEERKLKYFISKKNVFESFLGCSCGARSFVTLKGLYRCPKCNKYYTDEEFNKNKSEYLIELKKIWQSIKTENLQN